MKKMLFAVFLIAGAALLGGYLNGASCTEDPAPGQAVKAYLEAIKEKRFVDAYDVVTARMSDGKPREEWAALQQKIFELGAVSLGVIDVRKSKRERMTVFQCAPSARVPNVLHAADVLNNQGSTEFEVYTVLKVGGKWRVDGQETLFGETAIRSWFPDDPIPALKDTLPTH